MFKGMEKKKCVRLEVICDDFLYISRMSFVSPGARNDLNILYSSDHFNRIRMGRWPPTMPETMIGTLPLTWYYYLADGIYPRWRIFVRSITDPRTVKEEAFSRQQEAVRKGVERVFGVLFQHFKFYTVLAACGILNPCESSCLRASSSTIWRSWSANMAKPGRASPNLVGARCPAASCTSTLPRRQRQSTCTCCAPWPSRWRAVLTISVSKTRRWTISGRGGEKTVSLSR
jgi:Plant transposon protein